MPWLKLVGWPRKRLLGVQQKKLDPFVLDQGKVRSSKKAYPGTMVVYTAARLRNLDPADAAKVAQAEYRHRWTAFFRSHLPISASGEPFSDLPSAP